MAEFGGKTVLGNPVPLGTGYQSQVNLAEPVTLGKFIYVSNLMVLIC